MSPSPAEVYDAYFVPAKFAPLARVLVEAAQPQPGEHVIDLACGTGVVAHALADAIGPGGHAIGVDINPGMLAVARARDPRIEWREASALATGLATASATLVTCQQGLQFFPDRAAGAREMRRLLAPNGRAVIAVWRAAEEQPVFGAVVRAEARHLGVAPEAVTMPFSLGDPDALRALLRDAGFARVDVTARTLDVRFPDPERFLLLAITSTSAVIAQLRVDIPRLVEAVAGDVRDELARYRDGDALAFAMPFNLAVAYA